MKCVLLACLLAILVVASTEAAKLPATKLPRGWKKVNPKAGELNPNQQFHMTLALRRNNLEKLDKIFWEVSDPQNPKYGNHLNHEEMRSLVSPGPVALSTVTSWLKSNGVNNFMVARHEDSISFDATMSQIQKLLKVKFSMYESKIDKRRVAKALGVMVVPDAVAEVVEVIAGHRGFPLPKGSSRPKINKNLRSEETNVTPRKLYESYNMTWFPKTPAGKRNIQSFFQAQGQAVSASDLSTFCQTFLPEITNCTISKYIGDNEGAEPGIESSLDSEFIFATGRGTETWVYSYNNMDFCGDLIRWGAAVLSEETFPYVISMSYGAQALPNYCLGPDVDRLSRDVQKMGAMGITVIIASGDNGSGEDSRMGYNYGLLGASMPASIPYCIAVGSTTFITGNSGQQQATADFGSGGGFSFDYAMPAHQVSAVNAFFATNFSLPPPLSYNASGRGTPDVSVLGDNFFIISGGAWEGVSGTSCSTPSFAGMVTLLNNIRLEAGKTLGFLGPLIYQNPNAFTDIVVGNNDVNSDGYGWYTVAGWDPATGLGTPNFGNLAEVVKTLNARDFANSNANRIPVN